MENALTKQDHLSSGAMTIWLIILMGLSMLLMTEWRYQCHAGMKWCCSLNYNLIFFIIPNWNLAIGLRTEDVCLIFMKIFVLVMQFRWWKNLLIKIQKVHWASFAMILMKRLILATNWSHWFRRDTGVYHVQDHHCFLCSRY